jgi:hypothetical protein
MGQARPSHVIGLQAVPTPPCRDVLIGSRHSSDGELVVSEVWLLIVMCSTRTQECGRTLRDRHRHQGRSSDDGRGRFPARRIGSRCGTGNGGVAGARTGPVPAVARCRRVVVGRPSWSALWASPVPRPSAVPPRTSRCSWPPARCRACSALCWHPPALSPLTSTFTDSKDRAKAVGIHGAIAGVGGAVGLLLGGLLTRCCTQEPVGGESRGRRRQVSHTPRVHPHRGTSGREVA